MQGGNGNEYKKGLWTAEEDRILIDYVRVHGKGKWNHIAKVTGLKRCGKSCRLRWINYLSPNVKRDDFSEEEDDLIIRLHKLLGNRWSLIAGRVPGRTDNQVKNHWNTHLSKKLGVKSKKLGIKRGKCKAKASSSSFSKELVVNLNVELSSNDAPIPDNNDRAKCQNVLEGNSEIAREVVFPSPQGSWMNDYDDNSFWFTNEDSYLYTSNLMENFDDSFDLVWHGL